MNNAYITLKRRQFWALCLTLFMIAYNLAVLPPAMPLMVREFDSSIGYVQIALVLFSLVTASFAPTTENLCRFYGREQVFRTGLLCYGIGIVMTALSPGIGLLVLNFSLLTGLAATPLVSAPWAIMDYAYDGKEEQRATLIFILGSVLGGLSGGILGGLIAFEVGWRWAFAPSLFVLLLVLWGVRSLPPTTTRLCRDPIDWVGGLLSLLGMGSILLGLSLSGEFGWWFPRRVFSVAGVVIPPFTLSIVPLLMSVGLAALGLFIFWQRRQSNRGASLLRVGLLRKRAFVCGMLAAMLHTLIASGIQFNLYQLLPKILGLNPLQTAIAILPYNLVQLICLIALFLHLKLDQKFAPKHLVYSGVGLLSVGLFALYSAADENLTVLKLLPGLILMGVGSALFVAYIAALTYSVANYTEKPEGTGIYNPVQNLGTSLGRGILGTALVSFASQGIVDRVVDTLGKQLSSIQRQEAITRLQTLLQTYSMEEVQTVFARLPAPVQPYLQTIVTTSAYEGFRVSLLIALILSALCLLLTIALPPYPLRQPKP